MTEIEPRKLSFKQREGIATPLPIPAKESLPIQLRNKIWHHINTNYVFTESNGFNTYTRTKDVYKTFFITYILDNTEISHENIDNSKILNSTRMLCLKSEYSNFLNFVESFLRYAPFQKHKEEYDSFFKKHNSGWKLLYEKDEIGFYYSQNEQEIETIEKAYTELSVNEFAGGKKHLVAATKYFTDGKWADSIRESIHAVEAVCNSITGVGTLGKAIAAIEKKHKLNPRLKQAVEQLYAYTNSEQGIRHALLEDEANCDQADAQFMLGACAAFISYLCAKAEIA